MRIRTIGTEREVSHVWAQANNGVYGAYPNRTKAGTFFFDGSTIYSYGYHFAIATHVTNKKGAKAILFTLADYSKTTGGHKSIVRSAIRSETKVFFVPNLTNFVRSLYHGQNPDKETLLPILRAYIDRAKQTIEKAVRSRKYGEMLFDDARKILADAKEFASFYSLRNKVPTFEELTSDQAIQKAKDRVKKQAEETARLNKIRAKQEAERRKAQREYDLERFNLWKQGRGSSCPFSYRTDENGSAYLAVFHGSDGDEVQTSQGALVPIEHGRRAYRFIKLCRMTGREFLTNGKTVRVGHYSFTSIDAQGNSKIGCHFISWERLEEFAREIGWNEDHADAEALESSINQITH